MATLQLASWVTNLTYADLTPGIPTAANKSLYNWAGCAIGGFADAQVAALVNGIASHVDDYDDTHLEIIIHPAGPAASALLAIAEAHGPVTGHDFITAFVAGVEAECKLGLSISPEHYDVGWHITSTTGSVGAAIDVGKLLGLDTTHMQHAIGVAATQVVGMQEFFSSDTKSFHVGRAAQDGMLAALLAKNGYTSSLQALEAIYDWLHVVSTRENATAYFDQLGDIWEIEKNMFKPFQCGIVMHPVIDGAIQLSNETVTQGKSVSNVKAVELRVNPEVLILTGKIAPQTGLEGNFSIYHAAAVGLLYGEATPSQFSDDVVKNETVVDMSKKVNVTTDEGVSKAEAYITLHFDDSSTAEKHVEHAKGSIENPLTDVELQAKFMEQVTLAIGERRAENAYKAFTGLQDMADVALIRQMY